MVDVDVLSIVITMNFIRTIVQVNFKQLPAAFKWIPQQQRLFTTISSEIISRRLNKSPVQSLHDVTVREVSVFRTDRNSIESNVAPLVLKKRPVRKKRSSTQAKEGKFNVVAYATANEYDLDGLHTALVRTDLFELRNFFADPDQEVLYIQLKASESSANSEPHDIFFFHEGSTVLWNCSDEQTTMILSYLKPYEIKPYDAVKVENEKEIMDFAYTEHQNGGLKKEVFLLRSNDPQNENDLCKYTYSNAMTSSVKLAIWEAMLNEYIDGLTAVTSDLKNGKTIRMTRKSMLQKTGELFALKHLVNLNSELLGTPDFYWEHESLEKLFTKTCNYFSIPKRKRVSL